MYALTESSYTPRSWTVPYLVIHNSHQQHCCIRGWASQEVTIDRCCDMISLETLIDMPQCILFQLTVQHAEGAMWFCRTAIWCQFVGTHNCVSVCDQFLCVFESFCFNLFWLTCHCYWQMPLQWLWIVSACDRNYCTTTLVNHYGYREYWCVWRCGRHPRVDKDADNNGGEGQLLVQWKVLMRFTWSRQDQLEDPRQQSALCAQPW